MNGTLLRTSRQASRYCGHFWYFFFKLEDGKSARSCIAENMGNFSKWKSFCGKENVLMSGLVLKGSNLIDADCSPKEIK